MATLVGGVDSIFVDGTVKKAGDDVSGSDEQLNGYRAAGAVFEGDAQSSPNAIVSTPENPIPTDLSGNSMLTEHQEVVAANTEASVAQAEAAEETQAAQAEADAAQEAADAAAAEEAAKAAEAPAHPPASPPSGGGDD